MVLGPSQQRTFSIDISKFEFCSGKAEVLLDDYTVYVYTLPMIAVEKLRALCQQMREYSKTDKSTPRARDLFDIYMITKQEGFSLDEYPLLIQNIFEAKSVPLSLIAKLPEYREFHRDDWNAVSASVTAEAKADLQDYDFYFNWLIEETLKLKPLWIENPPA